MTTASFSSNTNSNDNIFYLSSGAIKNAHIKLTDPSDSRDRFWLKTSSWLELQPNIGAAQGGNTLCPAIVHKHFHLEPKNREKRTESVGCSGMMQRESMACLLNKQGRSPRRHQHLHSSSLIHTFLIDSACRNHEEEEEEKESAQCLVTERLTRSADESDSVMRLKQTQLYSTLRSLVSLETVSSEHCIGHWHDARKSNPVHITAWK